MKTPAESAACESVFLPLTLRLFERIKANSWLEKHPARRAFSLAMGFYRLALGRQDWRYFLLGDSTGRGRLIEDVEERLLGCTPEFRRVVFSRLGRLLLGEIVEPEILTQMLEKEL